MTRAEGTEEPASGEEPAAVDETGSAGAGDDLDLADWSGLPPDELGARLRAATEEIARLQDQLLRRQAELINYRRRVQKERADILTVAQADLLEGLVPVIDDFERAVEVESEDARTYHEGMQLILRGVHGVLERLGVERFEPRGEQFDPRVHEAIARQPADGVPEGEIIDVFQPGYRLKDRLIRPASVVVAYRAPAGGDRTAGVAEGGSDDQRSRNRGGRESGDGGTDG